MINVSKKLLALVMAMLMIFSGMVISASAENVTVGKDVSSSMAVPVCQHDTNTGTITITNYKKSDTITVDDVAYGYTFEISPSTGVLASFTADDKPIFSQLAKNTVYTVYVKVNDATNTVTGSVSAKLLLAQDPPADPVPSVVTSTSITIAAAKGCKYSLRVLESGETVYGWTTANNSDAILFDELTPNTWYVVAAKKEGTTTHYESAEATATIKTKKIGNEAVPALVLKDKTNTSIVVEPVENAEFSLDGRNWQSSNEFTGLKANTQYTIYARFKFEANQDPSEISDALIVTTNKGANFEASDKKLALKVEGDNFAGEEIKFTLTGDGPANMNDVVYGDTRIVPVAYTVKFGETTIKEAAVFENAALVSQKGSFVPGEEYAEKVVNVHVIFRQEEYKGKNADGSANWVEVKSIDKSFEVKVGKVDNVLNKASGFFNVIANFLFNTVPSFLAKALGSDVWKRLFDALGDLGLALG